MNARASRHRGEKTPAARWRDAQVVLVLLGLVVMITAYVWFAVATDNVLLAIGLMAGSLLGNRLHEKRKARRRQRGEAVQQGEGWGVSRWGRGGLWPRHGEGGDPCNTGHRPSTCPDSRGGQPRVMGIFLCWGSSSSLRIGALTSSTPSE